MKTPDKLPNEPDANQNWIYKQEAKGYLGHMAGTLKAAQREIDKTGSVLCPLDSVTSHYPRLLELAIKLNDLIKKGKWRWKDREYRNIK